MPNLDQFLLLFAVNGLIGGLLTPFITFAKTILKLDEGEDSALKRRTKWLLTVVTCLVGGVLGVAIFNMPINTLEGIIVAATFVFVGANATYNLLWKDSTNKIISEKSVTKAAQKLA